MTVLIVGGAGFIGAALTENLLERGEEVVSVDVAPQAAPSDESLVTAQADVTEFEEVLDVCEQYTPDAVVNLAYLLGAESDANPDRALEVNCVGMDNVMRAAGEADVSRVVYASSVSVYGRPENYEGPVTEETAPVAACADYPSMFYNATNQLNEYQGRLYADRYDYSAVAIRPSMVFGPGRGGGLNSWIADFVRNPATGSTGHIPYLPDRQLCLVYVDDVAQLFAEAATGPAPDHHAYNTGGGKIAAGDLARLVEDEIGGTVECADSEDDELQTLLVSSETNDRARQEFDYEPRPLREGIRKYAATLE